VYNFIAGLILTYERPVQVGDIVQLNTLMGSIKEIGVRSSRVQTYDGAEVVVPNGNLISNEVINWTLSNNHKRQELKFKASTNADPQEIVEILKTIPLQNPKVIQDPSPLALFEGYSDEGTLDFRLLFWTHVDVGLSSKSEVGLAIYKELQKRGYEIPVQKSTIRIENNNSDKPSNGF
jgi:potassium efflux system protein